jgi:hypothetical protein
VKNEKDQVGEQLDIALERIAAEREARMGRLDLGNGGLTRLPEGMVEMEWLESLVLGGVTELEHLILNLGKGSGTEEWRNPNRSSSGSPISALNDTGGPV